jgi:hypothetical protein
MSGGKVARDLVVESGIFHVVIIPPWLSIPIYRLGDEQ